MSEGGMGNVKGAILPSRTRKEKKGSLIFTTRKKTKKITQPYLWVKTNEKR